MTEAELWAAMDDAADSGDRAAFVATAAALRDHLRQARTAAVVKLPFQMGPVTK